MGLQDRREVEIYTTRTEERPRDPPACVWVRARESCLTGTMNLYTGRLPAATGGEAPLLSATINQLLPRPDARQGGTRPERRGSLPVSQEPLER